MATKNTKKRAKAPVESGVDSPVTAEVVDVETGVDDDEALVGEIVDDSAAADAELAAADEGAYKNALEAADKATKSGSLAKRDPLQAYMHETKRYPLLTREQEHELAVRYIEHGDMAAARRLVESNLRLVVKIAYEYRRAHRHLLDLVQEGNIGLLQAVKKFDPYRGVKLSTYAAWWIRAYILRFVLNNWRMVKIGTTQAQRKLFFGLRKEKERLERMGVVPDAKALAEALDVREKDVVEMEKRLAAPDASLNVPVGGDDDGGQTRLDLLEDSEQSSPESNTVRRQFDALLQDKLTAFGKTVEGRDETIFRERWLTDEPLTLQAIGDRYGISRERARQIEKRLMGKLRAFLEQELGTDVDIGALRDE